MQLQLHPISLYIILICPINGNINFDLLIMVMSAKFLHCKIILYPFLINEYFVGKYFETMEISYSSSNFTHWV